MDHSQKDNYKVLPGQYLRERGGRARDEPDDKDVKITNEIHKPAAEIVKICRHGSDENCNLLLKSFLKWEETIELLFEIHKCIADDCECRLDFLHLGKYRRDLGNTI